MNRDRDHQLGGPAAGEHRADRGDGRDPVYYHEPKGRVTEPTLSAWRLPFAIADRTADLTSQVARGVERAVESRGPCVLLISGEDLA